MMQCMHDTVRSRLSHSVSYTPVELSYQKVHLGVAQTIYPIIITIFHLPCHLNSWSRALKVFSFSYKKVFPRFSSSYVHDMIYEDECMSIHKYSGNIISPHKQKYQSIQSSTIYDTKTI